MAMNADNANARFAFFFPGARVLSPEEVEALPAEKKQAAAAAKEGVWVEIDCPDGTCIEEGKIVVPAAGTQTSGEKGYWLNLFCPEDSCKISEMTDLP
jgi:hypothetical protein